MRYGDLIQFEPIESVIQLLDANRPDEAKKLVGGHIYFHRKKSEPSFYGGSIRSFRIKQDDPHRGSIIFEFEYLEACRGIKADKCGWSLEKKIV